MKKKIVLTMLALLAPLTARAADYPVNFGEIKNGVVIPTRTLKICPKTSGYTYGFEILLPENGTHEVSADLRWPTDANCSSCAHAMDSYGKHAGRYVKRFTFGEDEKPGDYSLSIIVDQETLTTVKFKVETAKSCP